MLGLTISCRQLRFAPFCLSWGRFPECLTTIVSPKLMRPPFVALIGVALIACLASYVMGYRAGIKQSPLREERQGQVIYALGMYKAAEATNWTKVQSFLDTQIVSFTRDYERRFGVPSGTNVFDKRFTDAKLIADRIEKQMVPVNATPER